nr:dienelactone hydrolase [Herbaspirillum sp. ASV7]
MKFYLFILALVFSTSACADSAAMHAGVTRVAVTAESGSSEVLVWYPTETAEVPWQAGPFMIPASRNTEVAEGKFPVILLSHGGGPTGGTPLILLELSAALARHGFVVVAPFHGKAPLAMRTKQVVAAWQAVRENARIQPHLDAERLGMLGFSLGGAVALELAGAIPDIPHYQAYCAAHPDDVMSCDHAPGGQVPQRQALVEPPAPLPRLSAIKALVLLDPLAALFRRSGLAGVNQPTLLFRPVQSQLPAEANAAGLMKELPKAPEFVSIPGGHFIFTDACTPALASAAAEICRDPEGTKDRAAIHRSIERQIVAFFEQNL